MNKKANLAPSGICTFCRTPYILSLDEINADIAVLGIPYDGGTGFRPGTRFGPRSIREYSMRYNCFEQSSEIRGYWDMETRKRYLSGVSAVDCGDIDVVPLDLPYLHQQIDESVKKILKSSAFPVFLGGDHSLTYPIVRAFEKKGPIGFIHLDAHLDRYEAPPGVKEGYFNYGHGSPIRMVAGLEFIENIVSIGMRGIRAQENEYLTAEERGEVLIPNFMVQKLGISKTLELIPAFEKCYVTIDIDVLNSSQAYGLCSPEADGMDYSQVKRVLFGIAEKSNIIGFDVMCVNPSLDPTGRTPLFAVQLIVEFLGAIFG